MIRFSIILIFLSLSLRAEEFQPLKTVPKTIKCSVKNQSVFFEGTSQHYPLYDKNTTAIKLIKCEKITIQEQNFFSLLFSSEITESSALEKILTFEVALLDKKTQQLKTARSEIVDQIELSGDLSNVDFESSVKASWGLSKKDHSILLKLEMSPKNEKPFSYLLKLNQKSSWFENILENTAKKKKN